MPPCSPAPVNAPSAVPDWALATVAVLDSRLEQRIRGPVPVSVIRLGHRPGRVAAVRVGRAWVLAAERAGIARMPRVRLRRPRRQPVAVAAEVVAVEVTGEAGKHRSRNHCQIVAFRSAKGRSFAERKTALVSRTVLRRLPGNEIVRQCQRWFRCQGK